MVQRRNKDGERERISVSLDPEDYEWIKGFAGPSDSYKLSRIVKAARLAGLTLDDALKSGGIFERYRDWLKAKRKKTKVEIDLLESVTAFLNSK